MSQNINEVKKCLKPFDVICYYKPDIWPPHRGWLKRFGYWVLSKPITWEAKNVFGSKSDWKIFHVEIYLGEGHNLVIEPPKLHWGPVEDLKHERFSVFRMRNFEFSDEDAATAIDYLNKRSPYYRDNGDEYTMKFIGSLYNFGDLGNFLVNDLAGNVVNPKYKPFSVSRKDTVCSIGISSFFDAFRRYLLKEGRPAYNKLFQKINREKLIESNPKYLKKILEDYDEHGHVSIASVRPCFFGNSDFFENEFELVESFR